jgi:peroxiredoxin Q/BCP
MRDGVEDGLQHGLIFAPGKSDKRHKTPAVAFAFYGRAPNLKHMKTLFATLLMSLLPFFGDAAEKLAVGASIPDVTCNDQDGKAVSLAKEGAKGYLLVYFYPKAKTGGCTKQGCSLRDNWAELQKAGVNVLGVSTDDEKLQKEFKEEQKFPFRLLADKEKKAVSEAFGILVPLKLFAGRSAFLFKDGKCVYADHKGHTGDQAQVILAFIAGAKK